MRVVKHAWLRRCCISAHPQPRPWISGIAYCDVNDNGVFDPGIDIPLDGVIINLEHADNGFQTSVVSGSNGPGAYYA